MKYRTVRQLWSHTVQERGAVRWSDPVQWSSVVWWSQMCSVMSRENALSKSKKHLGRNDLQAGTIRDLPTKDSHLPFPGSMCRG